MGSVKRFNELEIWQMARSLADIIWNLSLEGSFKKDYGLKDQINTSTGSTMDNIAEGFGRGGNREFVNFLSYSRASNDETQSQLFRAFDRGHITEIEFNDLKNESEHLGIKINKLISYLINSGIKGQKFKKD